MWLPGVLLLCLAYNGCGWKSAVGLMCAALFCNGAVTASFIVNFTDIAPNFSGTLLGVEGTVYSVEAFLAPVVVGLITEGQQTLSQWRKVFWTCVPMYAVSGLFFLMFSSVSVQPWNAIRETENDEGAQGENLKEIPKKSTIQSKVNINYDVLPQTEAEEDLESGPNSEHQ